MSILAFQFRHVQPLNPSSDHVEGEAETARKQEHFKDDGVIDKQEQKELDRVHKRQLESRGRGPAQIKAYRSAKWMIKVGRPDTKQLSLRGRQGFKDRLPGNKTHTRERELLRYCGV